MTFEIPDELLPKITKGLQEMCILELEAEDPPPGIGKTSNQLKWFECLNDLLNEQMKKEEVKP